MSILLQKKFIKGQALLLVLLAMSVVLVVSLSVVSRSITDVSVTSREEDSTRAFVAAETGVERALIVGNTSCVPGAGDPSCPEAGYSATVVGVGSGSGDINYPVAINSGDSAPIWFVAHDSAGNIICNAANPCLAGDRIKVCWGQSGTPIGAVTPALEVTIFYANTPGSYATTRIAKGGYDPNPGRGNNFLAPDAGTCSISGKSYQFQKTIVFGAGAGQLNIPNPVYTSPNQGLLFAKLRLLYNNVGHEVGVTTTGIGFVGTNPLFPSQGLDVTSTGSSGDANRKLRVFQGFSEPPAIFDSLIYSNTGVTK